MVIRKRINLGKLAKKELEKKLKVKLNKISSKQLASIIIEFNNILKNMEHGIMTISFKIDLKVLCDELWKRGWTVNKINNLLKKEE